MSLIGCPDISDETNFGCFLVHRCPKLPKMSVLTVFRGVMYHGSVFLGDITSFEIRTGSYPCPSKKIETSFRGCLFLLVPLSLHPPLSLHDIPYEEEYGLRFATTGVLSGFPAFPLSVQVPPRTRG